jgi:hypothetical protein
MVAAAISPRRGSQILHHEAAEKRNTAPVMEAKVSLAPIVLPRTSAVLRSASRAVPRH